MRFSMMSACAALLASGSPASLRAGEQPVGPAPVLQAKPTAQVRVISEAELRNDLLHRKGRPVVLHFWATWCGPCIEELPALARMAEHVRRAGVDFVAVSLDEPTPRSARHVSAVLTARVRDPQWSSILKVEDVGAFLTSLDPDWEGAIPVFFAFDRQSKLRRTHLGNITRAEFAALIAGITSSSPGNRPASP
jgi:thiol-disulfide isomerase/thioredoxin